MNRLECVNVAATNLSKSRRDLLKTALILPLVAVMAELSAVVRTFANPSFLPAQPSGSGFPRVKVANLADLVVNSPVNFNYPLDNEPNALVKLGQNAKGGIGPNSDIVAFSLICQHHGCFYNVSGTSGDCPCHGAVYNLVDGGSVTAGPAPRPVPQVLLELDDPTGDIYATGMTPPTIFGHNTGSDDVSYDLQGGTLVPEFPNTAFPLLTAVALVIGVLFTGRKLRENLNPVHRKSE
jgi:arsenite oxidase small subunit